MSSKEPEDWLALAKHSLKTEGAIYMEGGYLSTTSLLIRHLEEDKKKRDTEILTLARRIDDLMAQRK